MLRILATFLVIVTACSRGSLSDHHDMYMNIFGLPLADSVPNKGAFLGRALLADGAPAAWAQVDARHAGDEAQTHPLVTMTNEKGGFYLGALEPGTYDFYVRSPAGQATRHQAEVKAGDVTVVDRIDLQPTARVSGHAKLAKQPVHTGIVVNVPGTPFATFSDHEGAYYLDLPVGTYSFRADKDAYQPFETAAQDITSDTTLDFELAENPWPNGNVSVVSDDGYIVHGLVTTLMLEPVEGVRYFRMSGGGQRSWQALQEKVEIKVARPGAASVQIEFMDQYGKTSDPLEIGFYNTLLDETWRFVYGDVDGPQTFKAGSKIALLGANGPNYSADDSAVAIPIKTFQDVDEESVPEASAYPLHRADAYTQFNGMVTVEAGVQIRGAATFKGGLRVAGTADRPVEWKPSNIGRDQLDLSGSITIRDAVLDEMDLDLSRGIRTNLQIINASLSATTIGFYPNFWSTSSVDSSISIKQSTITNGVLATQCWHDQSGNSGTGEGSGNGSGSGSGDGSGSGPLPVGSILVNIEDSVLDHSPLVLRCVNFDPSFSVKVSLARNNSLGLATGGFYVEGSLPTAQRVTYDVGDNYYQTPDRLYERFGADGWPAFFGTKAAAPFASAGRP